MQTFRYEAADAQGRIETGTLEADSQRGALGQLRARGLTPLEVREQAGGGTGQGAPASWPACWPPACRWRRR